MMATKGRLVYPERRKAVKALAVTGMTSKEIAEQTGMGVRQVGYYIRQLMIAGELRPAAARKWSVQRGILRDAKSEGLETGKVGDALLRLPPETLTWLLRQTPSGATVADVMLGFVIDAYTEEMTEDVAKTLGTAADQRLHV
jgi:hypothetical protein